MLRTSGMRKTLVSLFFISIWLPSSATGGHIFSELKGISRLPSADGEASLMRLRSCHDDFMVQCRPCEIIRIVNASYAASREHQRNPIQGCSDISFQHEFDCLHSANSRYMEEITKSCYGMQSCDLKRARSSFSCGSLSRTWSCCLEIYYTCAPKSDQIQTALFRASDPYGNVNDLSLQCQSSDLSVDSVMLAFNSSAEFHEGGVCYKRSPNTDHVKRRCERRECSGISVTGSKGCGRNEYVFNHGVYVCYICKSSKAHQTIDAAPQSSATTTKSSETTKSATTTASSSTNESSTTTKSLETTESTTTVSLLTIESLTTAKPLETSEPATATMSSSMSQSSPTLSSTTEPEWLRQGYMWVIVGVSVVIGVLLVECIVCAKRRRNRAFDSSRLRRTPQGKRLETTRGSQASEEEQGDYSYPDMSPVYLQLNDAGKDHRYEVCNFGDNAESGLQNETEHLDRAWVKEQASAVSDVSLRVLYENVDKEEEANKFHSSSNYNQIAYSRSYLELVAVDDDAEEGVGKGLKSVCVEQKDFRKGLEPIVGVQKESNPDCASSGIRREEPKIAYEKLDLSYLHPVYEELNLSTMDENPVNIGK